MVMSGAEFLGNAIQAIHGSRVRIAHAVTPANSQPLQSGRLGCGSGKTFVEGCVAGNVQPLVGEFVEN